MEKLITTIFTALVDSGANAAMLVGWVMFAVERYYFSWKKDKQHRSDIDSVRRDYAKLGDELNKTITKFIVVLEVLKDRTR